MKEYRVKAKFWEFLGDSQKTAIRLIGDKVDVFSGMLVVDSPPDQIRNKKIVIELQPVNGKTSSRKERRTSRSAVDLSDSATDPRDGLD